jgi:PAS domain S-box-containing protein
MELSAAATRQIGIEQNGARTIIEGMPVALYTTDAQGQITFANPTYRRLFALSPDEDLGNWAKNVHPADQQRMIDLWEDFCRDPRPVIFEYRCLKNDGACITLTEQVVAAGAFKGFIGTITDISEQVRAQTALRQLEILSHQTILQAPIGIIYLDRDGKILQANQTFCHWLELTSEELEGKPLTDFVDPTDATAIKAAYRQMWDGQSTVVDHEKRYVRADGVTLWARVTGALIRDEANEATRMVEFFRDISARKEMTVALERQQKLTHAVVANLPISVRACDAAGQVFLQNAAADRIFLSADADTGETYTSPQRPLTSKLLRADNATPVPAGEWPLMRALRGEPVDDEEYMVERLEGVPLAVIASAQQLVGTQGEIIGAVAITQDVTQKRKLERDLAQAQKLESIGHLAAGVAHEINTPMQFIGDNVRFIDESFRTVLALAGELRALVTAAAEGVIEAAPIAAALAAADLIYLQEEVPKAISQTLDGVTRVTTIVSAMKEFSHPGTDRTPLDLNRAILSTVTVASTEWKYVAEIKTEFDSSLPLVPVMPGAFNQVILNLLVNAAHAIAEAAATAQTPAKGAITISTRHVADSVEIQIKDTGCGIPANVLDRIFDPFFTTKPIGKGTGQGLAIAHDVVVKKHGGTIAAASELGVGTTFTLRLPLQPVHATSASGRAE